MYLPFVFRDYHFSKLVFAITKRKLYKTQWTCSHCRFHSILTPSPCVRMAPILETCKHTINYPWIAPCSLSLNLFVYFDISNFKVASDVSSVSSVTRWSCVEERVSLKKPSIHNQCLQPKLILLCRIRKEYTAPTEGQRWRGLFLFWPSWYIRPVPTDLTIFWRGWWEENTHMKAESRSGTREYGKVCAITSGAWEKREWPVECWAILTSNDLREGM